MVCPRGIGSGRLFSTDLSESRMRLLPGVHGAVGSTGSSCSPRRADSLDLPTRQNMARLG